jgi:type IV pilus assembly protein PilO
MPSISFSPLTDRLNQLTLSQKLLLAGLGIVLCGVALAFLLFMPLWDESNLLQEDINREKLKLAEIVRTRAQITRFKRELAEMDARYKEIQTLLPEAKEIPHLLKYVADLGQKQGLEFVLFKPEKENPQEYVAEIPITLNLKGHFHQIGIFFDGVRRIPRIINVKQLELGAFEEKTGLVNARCQLATYRILPPPPPSATPKPKDEKKK